MSKYVWGVVRKKRRLIDVWLCVLMILSTNFFELVPIIRVLGVDGGYTFYLITLFILFTFYRKKHIREYLPWMKPFWWFMIGILLSCIPALIYYGQGIGRSLIANRHMLFFCAFPVFIAIRPTEREIRSSLYAFSIVYLAVILLVNFVDDSLIRIPEYAIGHEGDYVYTVQGFRYVVLGMVMALDRMMYKFNSKNLFWFFLLFGIIFLVQNRTALLAAVVISMFAIWDMKMSARKLLLMTVVFAAALFLVAMTASQWGLLYDETITQLSDPDYNRIKSMNYVFAHRDGFIRYILGDGFISGNVNPILQRLAEEGIYHSDVGLFGTWHQYGLIPVLTILVCCIKGLAAKKSFISKSIAIYILVGTATLSYFGLAETLMLLAFFQYMYNTDRIGELHDNVYDPVKKKAERGRYRSLAR